MSSYNSLFNTSSFVGDSVQSGDVSASGSIDFTGANLVSFPVDNVSIKVVGGVLAGATGSSSVMDPLITSNILPTPDKSYINVGLTGNSGGVITNFNQIGCSGTITTTGLVNAGGVYTPGTITASLFNSATVCNIQAAGISGTVNILRNNNGLGNSILDVDSIGTYLSPNVSFLSGVTGNTGYFNNLAVNGITGNTATFNTLNATNLNVNNLDITSLTPGSVLFAGTSGLISQNNSQLYWDNTKNSLAIGPTSATTSLSIYGVTGAFVGANIANGFTGSYNEAGLTLIRGDRAFGYAQVHYYDAVGGTNLYSVGLRAGDTSYHIYRDVPGNTGELVTIDQTGLLTANQLNGITGSFSGGVTGFRANFGSVTTPFAIVPYLGSGSYLTFNTSDGWSQNVTSGTNTPGQKQTIYLPVTSAASDYLVSRTSTDTLTNKTWNGNLITGTYGGCGVNNGSNTLTINANSTINQDVSTTASPTFNLLFATGGLIDCGSTSTPGSFVSYAGNGNIGNYCEFKSNPAQSSGFQLFAPPLTNNDTIDTLGTVQTITAVKTFSGGISVGSNVSNVGVTLNNATVSYVPSNLNYYEEYINAMTSSTSFTTNPGNLQIRIVRIGKMVMFSWQDWGNFKLTSATTISFAAGSVPTRFCPAAYTFKACSVVINLATGPCLFEVAANGAAQIAQTPTTGTIYNAFNTTSTYFMYAGNLCWNLL